MSISVKSNELVFAQDHSNGTHKLRMYVTYQKEYNEENVIFITTTDSEDGSQHDFSMTLDEVKALLEFAVLKLEEVADE